MEAICGRCGRLAIALVFAAVCLGAPARANAGYGVTVFPGMQIYQGDKACMVGFVDPRLRIALTTGQCDGGPLITDHDQNLLGAVLLARRQTVEDAAADGAMLPVEYEVVALAPDVAATDLLPSGRQLREVPGLRALQGSRCASSGYRPANDAARSARSATAVSPSPTQTRGPSTTATSAVRCMS